MRGRHCRLIQIRGPFYFNPRPLAGATKDDEPEGGSDDISIHAPLRGRRVSKSCVLWYRRFQSTPPCGGDRNCAPGLPGSRYFNPRPLAGATMDVKHEAVLKIFQSTPPCGGDVFGPKAVPFQTNFNPRPLAGATIDYGNQAGVTLISIHAPLRGRRAADFQRCNRRNFNPRPLAGATQATGQVSSRQIFQSTPPCGGDR